MLDLSAAFDTVNHDLLLECLSAQFAVGGTVLKWIESYLSDRSFVVKCKHSISRMFHLKTGVPQGSVLGPILFNCYLAELFHLLDSLDINFHNYADDTQIWCSYDPSVSGDESLCRQKLSKAFEAISQWMTEHS